MLAISKVLTKGLITIGVCAAMSTTALAGGNGGSPNGKPFAQLDGQIIAVQGLVSSLEEQVTTIVGSVDTMEGYIIAHQDAILSLSDQNSTLQTQIDDNAMDIVSLEIQISDLSQESYDLKSEIDLLGDADGALQGKIDDNTAIIYSMQTAVDGLNTLEDQVNNNTDLIATIESRVEYLEDAIQDKQNIINGVCAEGETFVEVTPDGNLVCRVAVSGGGNAIADRLKIVSRFDFPRILTYQAGIAPFCPEGYMVTAGGYESLNVDIKGNKPLVNLLRSADNGQYVTLDGWIASGFAAQIPAYITTTMACTKFN